MNKTLHQPESVWDYPRPPRLERSSRHIVVEFSGKIIADTHNAFRVLETSHPPTYYIPPEDVLLEYLNKEKQHTFCEFKGTASYWSLQVGNNTSHNAAWSYPDPAKEFHDIKDYLAFYPGRVDACYVDGEPVQTQEGDFYGGWITSEIKGPFKGGAGTGGW